MKIKSSEFKPDGSTGEEETDMYYMSELKGADGAHYYLLKEDHHTTSNIKEAKIYLKERFDVISITVVNF